MPDKNQYKEAINELLGLKNETQYPDGVMEFYNKYNKQYSDPDWKELVDRQILENTRNIAKTKAQQNEKLKYHLEHLDIYREKKAQEFTDKAAEYQKVYDDLNARLDKLTSLDYTPEQRQALFQLKQTAWSQLSGAKRLAEFARTGVSGSFSVTGVGAVSLSAPDDPDYVAADEKIKAMEKQNEELKFFIDVKYTLGKNEYEMNPERVAAAREKYNQTKQEFESLSLWDRVWGRLLPASWYKPAAKYFELSCYKEALKDYHIDPVAPAAVEDPAPEVDANANVNAREELGETATEKLGEDVEAEKENVSEIKDVLPEGEKALDDKGKAI